MLDLGLTGGEIIILLIISILSLVGWWFIIKTAVKSGVADALSEHEDARRILERQDAETRERVQRIEAQRADTEPSE